MSYSPICQFYTKFNYKSNFVINLMALSTQISSQMDFSTAIEESQTLSTFHFEEPKRKMDILFYETSQSLKTQFRQKENHFLVTFAALLVYILFDYYIVGSESDKQVFYAMIVGLVVSLIQCILKEILASCLLENNEFLLDLSEKMNHQTLEPILGSIEDIKNCVSKTIFNAQHNSQIRDITFVMRMQYKISFSFTLEARIMKEKCWAKSLTFIIQLIGLASLIYSFMVWTNYQTSLLQTLFIWYYMKREAESKTLFLLLGCCIGCLPVCCFIAMCSFAWIWLKGQKSKSVKLPNQENANEDMITEAGGKCSICYQSFNIDDKVIRLVCSPKHMFHPLCISGWAKIKSNCPICRADIGNNTQTQQNAPI